MTDLPLQSTRRLQSSYHRDNAAAKSNVDDGYRDRLWTTGFAVLGVTFQSGLFMFGDSVLRMPLRMGIFVISLLFLNIVKGKGHRHPAAWIFQFVLIILAIGLLHPTGGGLIASVAQSCLYLAVLSPLIWVGRLRMDVRAVRQVALVLWAFHTCSAGLGALQVKYPHTFDGALSTNVDEQLASALSITTADGSRIMRPKGLTDSPGGAGSSGVYAIILSFGLLASGRGIVLPILSILSMTVSLFSIYISQGRTNLVLVAFAALAMILALFYRGGRSRHKAVLFLAVIAGVTVVGTSVAFAVGGEMTTDRWSTLLADDAQTVAYNNRGIFLDEIFSNDIYEYPLGAGMGRWGMMNVYFGDPSKAIWAEMMWQALLFDGGIPLMVIYVILLSTLLWTSWNIIRTVADDELAGWACVAFAYTLATVVASFAFPIYIKDAGMQMILLNACLYAAYRRDRTGAFTGLPNLAGYPAGSLPSHVSSGSS